MKLIQRLIWTLIIIYISMLMEIRSLDEDVHLEQKNNFGTQEKFQNRKTIERETRSVIRAEALGPGLEKAGVVATKTTYFEVFTKDTSNGTVEVTILDPHGRNNTVIPTISTVPGMDGMYHVEYIPEDPGIHSIKIMFAEQEIPGSPYGVVVSIS